MRIGKNLLGRLLYVAPLLAAPHALGVPSTQPSIEITKLIAQLGDEDFHLRQEAFLSLRQLGKEALPALRDAQFSPQTEIRERAADLLSQLQVEPIPHDLPEPPDPGNGGFYSNWARSELRGGTRIVDVNDNGRSVHIEQSGAGLHMSVRGQINGEPVVREYRVASLDELARANPRAYSLYRDSMQLAHNTGISAMGNMPGMAPFVQPLPFVRPAPFVLPPGMMRQLARQPIANDANADLEKLERDVVIQMNQAQLNAAQRNRVLAMINLLRRVEAPAPTEADQNRQMEEYNRRSDALRKQLRTLNLPDPGDALPPPPNERLGISINETPDGLMVSHVIPGGKGQKLGLQEADVIKKVDGQPIHSAHQLRAALADQAHPLTLEGQRSDSKPFTLTMKNDKPAGG